LDESQQPSLRDKLTSYVDAVSWASRALLTELRAARFDYPIEIDALAGIPGSLNYYMYGDRLSWSEMALDSQGVPLISSRLYKNVYHPSYVAWYGLVSLGTFLRSSEQRYLDIFLRQVDWLEDHAVVRTDGAVVWPVMFDWIEGTTYLKAPWVSAYAQGMVISALVRGWQITQKRQLLDLLSRSTNVFELDVRIAGLRDSVGGHVVYTERPGYPPPGPLDGFLTALLALYDLATQTKNDSARQLLVDGVDGLENLLKTWDYRRKWSWYSSRAYLCPPSYHIQNCVLLRSLARVLDRPALSECARRWDPNQLSAWDRIEVFLAFFITKNVHRLQHKTWRLKRPGTYFRSTVEFTPERWNTHQESPLQDVE